MQALFGDMPKGLLQRSKNAAEYYNSCGRHVLAHARVGNTEKVTGNPLSSSPFPQSSLAEFIGNPELHNDPEKEAFVDFVNLMLRLAPEERPTAEALLNHK